MAISNDTRGWILTAISGIACCFGACIICVDVIARQFRRLHDFKIAESDAFLSASLSLSAGVILYSALVSLLPSSKNYLKQGGYSPKEAGFLFIGLFLSGVFGIRILSRILHKFIPSHIVDCDHSHDDHENEETDKSWNGETTTNEPGGMNGQACNPAKASNSAGNHDTENTPLLSRSAVPGHPLRTATAPDGSVFRSSQANGHVADPDGRRPSSRITRTLSRTLSKYVSSRKDECDENGPCMGFSDPCGQDCFKIVQRRSNVTPFHFQAQSKAPRWLQISNNPQAVPQLSGEDAHVSNHISRPSSPLEQPGSNIADKQRNHRMVNRTRSATHHYHRVEHERGLSRHGSSHHHPDHAHSQGGNKDHHHHVPTNAFMSIGLQTSIAIALHKAPEGFITYATNHANPRLGFSVFVALFIHNITEGFALSLPLFLALNSRIKAIFWSAILGGLSQPVGAGIAALWFKVADQTGRFAPNEKVYGGIFAVTSGIMASVALSLLSESLQLSHNRNTCVAFAFVGMALLGISQALNAG